MNFNKEKVVILGAGPAGLTAAHELLANYPNKYEVIILEKNAFVGGLSRTVNYKGNLMDIGGHRFFSKSRRVNKWWQERLKIQNAPALDDRILKRDKKFPSIGADPSNEDNVFLIRDRISRIYYGKSFFDYPISLNMTLIRDIGISKTIKAGFSYLKSLIKKLPETSLENFYINRFGRDIYSMFFEKYTLKLWGRHPSDISAAWGCQRVKGISIFEVIKNAIAKKFNFMKKSEETSLIEQFIYPKFGPGQLWVKTADEIKTMGGQIKKEVKIKNVVLKENRAREITYEENGKIILENTDNLISSIPLKDLFTLFNIEDIPMNVFQIAQNLEYRDFITIGFLLRRMNLKNQTSYKTINNITPDCWIYIQEPQIKMGRIQIFNNWSPYLVRDIENTIWIGTEYFCTEGDSFWNKTKEELFEFAQNELISMNLINAADDILDWHCEKIQKAYPAYFGAYKDIDRVTEFLDTIENLYCIGRNGQHRYNNMDHSVITAFNSVENIVNHIKRKDNIWNVNTEKSYHEQKY